MCDCLDLTSRQLVPLPMCSGSGGTIPDAISNGNVTYTSLAVNSGRATYQCDEGFSISGDSTRECQGNGSWSGSPPTCQEEEEGILVCMYMRLACEKSASLFFSMCSYMRSLILYVSIDLTKSVLFQNHQI